MAIRAFFVACCLFVTALVPLVGFVSGWGKAAALAVILPVFFWLVWILWQMVRDEESFKRSRESELPIL